MLITVWLSSRRKKTDNIVKQKSDEKVEFDSKKERKHCLNVDCLWAFARALMRSPLLCALSMSLVTALMRSTCCVHSVGPG